jgi:hypothetical protein
MASPALSGSNGTLHQKSLGSGEQAKGVTATEPISTLDTSVKTFVDPTNPLASFIDTHVSTEIASQRPSVFLGSQDTSQNLVDHYIEMAAGASAKSARVSALSGAGNELANLVDAEIDRSTGPKSSRAIPPLLGAQNEVEGIVERELTSSPTGMRKMHDRAISHLETALAFAEALNNLERVGLYDSKASPGERLDGLRTFLTSQDSIENIVDLSVEDRAKFISQASAARDFLEISSQARDLPAPKGK